MKNKLQNFVIILSLLFCANSYGQQGGGFDFYTLEHQRAILNETQSPPPIDDKTDYGQEKDSVIGQLKVITENEDTTNKIVPGDELRISYNDRSKKEKAIYRVSEKGEIFMPLLGSTKITDLNRKQAREMLNSMLQEYIRNPELELDINAEGKYMLIGAVGAPGMYKIKPGLTLMEALLDGHYDRSRANLNSVIVIRGQNTKPTIMRLDIHKMIKRGDRTDNIVLKPGDLIHVPTSFIHNFNIFKDAVLKYVLDYYTLGGGNVLKDAP
ncbi:MAG: polysaccharide biosynthesis/export family protein [Candidatus Omnitrophica bacterium]|nr:polysaccharide biosynthesis/export family protein [Candidatus Omnitrophota bacterium]